VRALVRAFLGQPGSGKTYAMSVMAAEWRRRNPGRPIFSTYELRLPWVASVDPPGDTWGPVVPLVEARGGLLLIDEAAQLLDSRMFGKTPTVLLHKLMQVRKHGLECWWATQHLEYVDKRLRLLTFESYHCGSLANMPWPLPRGFLVTIRDGLRGRMCGFRYVRRSGKRDALYDTMQAVSLASYLSG